MKVLIAQKEEDIKRKDKEDKDKENLVFQKDT